MSDDLRFDPPIKKVVQKAGEMYCAAIIECGLHQLSYPEINYIKQTITTPQGGIYALNFMHVDGPKINLDAIRAQMANEPEPDMAAPLTREEVVELLLSTGLPQERLAEAIATLQEKNP